MNRYKEMLKQAIRGKASCNAIAQNRGFSHQMVRRWRDIAIALKLTETDIDGMTDSELRNRFRLGKAKPKIALPDWDAVEADLAQNYNLLECHARYEERVGNESAYAYSTFCAMMRSHQAGKVVIFRHSHVAGYAMQTDFAGYRPEGVEGSSRRKFELFLATLPASYYYFAICVRSQSTIDHVEAYVAALEFFGGAPEVLITDNLKAAVIARPRRKAPVINPVMLCAADLYNMRVEPTRVRRPQDKAAVEIAVKLVQSLLRLRLRSQPLLTLSEINKVLAEIILQINNRTMRRGNESRRERFERLDKPMLQKLSAERLQFLELPVDRRVQADHHIPFGKVNYSVPHKLAGKIVSVRSSSLAVEIRHDGQVVAIHPKCHIEGEYVTDDGHRPDNHLAWLNKDFASWQGGLCEDLRDLVNLTLHRNPNEKRERQRVIEKVKRLKFEYTPERVSQAARLARAKNAFTFRHIENMLKNNVDASIDLPPTNKTPIQARTNVRGAAYFARDLGANGGAAC